MKKAVFIVLPICLFLISSCKSKEEKALSTIKKEMFNTLYDFESYQPVETSIAELNRDKYGDTLVFDKIMLIQYLKSQLNKAEEKFDDAHRSHEIWFSDYYMSSTSRRKCKEAEEAMDEALKEMKLNVDVWKATNDSIKKIVSNCDGKPYGYRVVHKFRCKTKGGNPTLGTYIYFMDKKCSKIYRQFDEEDLTYEKYVELVDIALKETEKGDSTSTEL